MVCTGRFHDFVQKHEGQWKLLHRQPIYEKDRIDPVDPAAGLELDHQALAQFPEGYRHLAYIQTRIGYTVKMDMPMLKGSGVQDLYRRGLARRRAAGALHDKPLISALLPAASLRPLLFTSPELQETRTPCKSLPNASTRCS